MSEFLISLLLFSRKNALHRFAHCKSICFCSLFLLTHIFFPSSNRNCSILAYLTSSWLCWVCSFTILQVSFIVESRTCLMMAVRNVSNFPLNRILTQLTFLPPSLSSSSASSPPSPASSWLFDSVAPASDVDMGDDESDAAPAPCEWKIFPKEKKREISVWSSFSKSSTTTRDVSRGLSICIFKSVTTQRVRPRESWDGCCCGCGGAK